MEEAGREERRHVLRGLAVTLAGAVLLAVASVVLSQTSDMAAAIGVAGLIFLSSGATGAILGFLFAVPRVLSKENGAEEAGSAKPGKLLSSNTNLERISDWLTTMLVGVGLSQLHKINELLLGFSQFLATGAKVFGPSSAPTAGVLPAIGPFVLVFGTISGFMLMYLHTRLVLVRKFNQTEADLLGRVERAAVLDAVHKIDGENSFVLSQVTASDATSVEDALEVMFEALYRPEGYREVIELAGKLSNSAATKRADYWFYLAAAFGQKMKAASEPGEKQSARDNALDAARRAVKIDPAYRARLWAISNPEGSDDDLSELRDDPAFRKIVKR